MYIGEIPVGSEINIICKRKNCAPVEFPVIVRNSFGSNKKTLVTDVCRYNGEPVNVAAPGILVAVKTYGGLDNKDKGQGTIISNVKIQKYFRTKRSGSLMAITSANNSKPIDHRKAIRIPVNGTVFVKGENEVVACKIKDLSFCGIGFRNEQLPLEIGDIINLGIRIDGIDHTFNLPATVRRISPVEKSDTVFDYGCSFKEHTKLSACIAKIMQKRALS